MKLMYERQNDRQGSSGKNPTISLHSLYSYNEWYETKFTSLFANRGGDRLDLIVVLYGETNCFSEGIQFNGNYVWCLWSRLFCGVSWSSDLHWFWCRPAWIVHDGIVQILIVKANIHQSIMVYLGGYDCSLADVYVETEQGNNWDLLYEEKDQRVSSTGTNP